MFIFGDAYDEVIDALNAKSNLDEQAKALRRLNIDLRAISHMDSWAEMREVSEISYGGDAVQLPSNMIGIDLVWDDDNEIEYFNRNRAAIEGEEASNRYYTYPVGTALASVNDVAINQDGTTFDSPDLEALSLTTDEEWFYVEGEDQYYQITSNTGSLYTFAPAYRGLGNKTAAKIVVRPKMTLMLKLEGLYNVDVQTTTIDLHYWSQPETLRDPPDIVPLPTSDVLVLRSIANLPGARKKRPISERRVQAALDEALMLNPDKPQARVLRGIHGRKVDFTANPYARRGNMTGSGLDAMVTRWQTQNI